MLSSIVTIDVFKLSQHVVEIREEAVRLIATGHKQLEVYQLIDQK